MSMKPLIERVEAIFVDYKRVSAEAHSRLLLQSVEYPANVGSIIRMADGRCIRTRPDWHNPRHPASDN